MNYVEEYEDFRIQMIVIDTTGKDTTNHLFEATNKEQKYLRIIRFVTKSREDKITLDEIWEKGLNDIKKLLNLLKNDFIKEIA